MFFIFYINLIIVCTVPTHGLSVGGKEDNFFTPESDDTNLERNPEWKAQANILCVNFVTLESISQ